MEVKDILQINTTVIAGAFIFLSLSVVLLEESEKGLEEQQRLNLTNATKQSSTSDDIVRSNSHAIIAFLIIVPFAMSSLVAIAAEWDKDNPKVDSKRTMRASLAFMFWGFFMFFVIALLVYLGLIRFLD